MRDPPPAEEAAGFVYITLRLMQPRGSFYLAHISFFCHSEARQAPLRREYTNEHFG
jgi:hypothetical protein